MAPAQDGVVTKSPSPKEEEQDSFVAVETFAKPEEIVPASSPIAHHDLEEVDSADQVLSDKDWLALEHEPLTADLESEVVAKGSEDMLVPDSPRSNSYDGNARSSLDLERFAFTG